MRSFEAAKEEKNGREKGEATRMKRTVGRPPRVRSSAHSTYTSRPHDRSILLSFSLAFATKDTKLQAQGFRPRRRRRCRKR